MRCRLLCSQHSLQGGLPRHLMDDGDHIGRGHRAAAALQAALRLPQAHVYIVNRPANTGWCYAGNDAILHMEKHQ